VKRIRQATVLLFKSTHGGTSMRFGRITSVIGLLACCMICLACGDGHTEAQAEKKGTRRPWAADRDHSSLQFRTQHWGIHDVVGWFEDFDVKVVTYGDEFADAEIEVKINMNSIRMPNMEMAGNVEEMFDAVSFPVATYQSSRIERIDEFNYRVFGDLQVKGVTEEIELKVKINGYANDMSKGTPGVTFTAVLNRLHFGAGGIDFSTANGKPTIDSMIYITCNMRLYDTPLVK